MPSVLVQSKPKYQKQTFYPKKDSQQHPYLRWDVFHVGASGWDAFQVGASGWDVLLVGASGWDVFQVGPLGWNMLQVGPWGRDVFHVALRGGALDGAES